MCDPRCACTVSLNYILSELVTTEMNNSYSNDKPQSIKPTFRASLQQFEDLIEYDRTGVPTISFPFMIRKFSGNDTFYLNWLKSC